MKRFFRSRFDLELSETSLGYGRMSELLQDPRFAEICRLESQGKVQLVVQRENCVEDWQDSASASFEGAQRFHQAASGQVECAEELMSVGARLLSGYVQQLLELSPEEQRQALRSLSERAGLFSEKADCGELFQRAGAGCMSRSASCSTVDGSVVYSDADSSATDLGAGASCYERRLSGASAATKVGLPLCLRPPPGLEDLV